MKEKACAIAKSSDKREGEGGMMNRGTEEQRNGGTEEQRNGGTRNKEQKNKEGGIMNVVFRSTIEIHGMKGFF